MKRFIFVAIVASLIFSVNVLAAEKASETSVASAVVVKSINGLVIDRQTNESLAGAVVTVDGQKVYSDLDGNFTLNNVCEGKCEIKVSMISYQDRVLQVNTKDSETLQIQLSQR